MNTPMEVCTSLGDLRQWVAHRDVGKSATVDEQLRVLDQMERLGLVHTCGNVLAQPAYFCHCCGCCNVLGPVKYGFFSTHRGNFMPTLDEESCIACGMCTEKCQIDAVTMCDTEVPFINAGIHVKRHNLLWPLGFDVPCR